MRTYKKTPANLGKKIKALRKKRGLTQEELADIVGVTPTYIGFIEQGIRTPSLARANQLARALKTSISELF